MVIVSDAGDRWPVLAKAVTLLPYRRIEYFSKPASEFALRVRISYAFQALAAMSATLIYRVNLPRTNTTRKLEQTHTHAHTDRVYYIRGPHRDTIVPR